MIIKSIMQIIFRIHSCPVCKSDITDFISSALTLGMAESDINSEIADLKAELLIIERKIAQITPISLPLNGHKSYKFNDEILIPCLSIFVTSSNSENASLYVESAFLFLSA